MAAIAKASIAAAVPTIHRSRCPGAGRAGRRHNGSGSRMLEETHRVGRCTPLGLLRQANLKWPHRASRCLQRRPYRLTTNLLKESTLLIHRSTLVINSFINQSLRAATARLAESLQPRTDSAGAQTRAGLARERLNSHHIPRSRPRGRHRMGAARLTDRGGAGPSRNLHRP